MKHTLTTKISIDLSSNEPLNPANEAMEKYIKKSLEIAFTGKDIQVENVTAIEPEKTATGHGYWI